MTKLFEPLTNLLHKEFWSRLDATTDRFLLCAVIFGLIGAGAFGLDHYVRCEGVMTLPVYIAGSVLALVGISAMMSFAGALITLIGVEIRETDNDKPLLRQRLTAFGIYAPAAVCSAMLFITIAGSVGVLTLALIAGNCGGNSMSF